MSNNTINETIKKKINPITYPKTIAPIDLPTENFITSLIHWMRRTSDHIPATTMTILITMEVRPLSNFINTWLKEKRIRSTHKMRLRIIGTKDQVKAAFTWE